MNTEFGKFRTVEKAPSPGLRGMGGMVGDMWEPKRALQHAKDPETLRAQTANKLPADDDEPDIPESRTSSDSSTVSTSSGSSPFGMLRQEELQYMSLLQFKPREQWLFVVLRTRWSAKSGAVVDKLKTLGKWSGMSRRSIQRALASLEKAGLIRRKPHGIKNAAKAGVYWTTTMVPYEEWPTEPLARLFAAMVAYVRVFHRSSRSRLLAA